ncbi:MAG: PDZ domain-containing protein [Gemmatimonadales bacterium]|nr:PDZ domain-containing protein [Gemmatimonadales bacterium]
MNWTVTKHLLISIFALLVLGLGDAAAETRLLRYPDLQGDTLVFCYGGDIYTASTGGENVKQITDFPGEELLPKFSPDGRQIAFTAEFEGNTDVYVMSVTGGKPKRLTYHAAQDLVVDWHPDGTRVLFRSNRSSFSYRFRRLFEVAVEGGLPTVLDIPEAELSSYNNSGDKVAFCRTSTETVQWKRYRGGAMPKIWTYDFQEGKAELVIDDQSINHHPLWMEDRIYFVSDRGESKEQNLWVFNTTNKALRQITFYEEWGVNWPSRGGERVVYENEGRLFIYDARDDESTPVKIEIALPKDRLVEEKNVKDQLRAPAISPDGKELILCARGELFRHDPEKNRTRNLTQTSNANERSPVWSPDGQCYAYISDISGEEQVYIQKSDEDQKPIQVSQCESSRIGRLRWSPDSRKIGYADKRARFSFIDIESKETKQVFFDEYFGSGRFVSASWSPDSEWLTFSLGNPNWGRSVFLYSLESDQRFRVTDEYTSSFEPNFDPEGKYLFWISDCQINVRDSYGDGDHHMVNPSKIIVATLHKERLSPFAPEQKEKPAEIEGSLFPIRVDLEGLGDRIAALPIEESNYSRLTVLKNKLIYRSQPDQGKSSFKLFDLASSTESDLIKDVWYCIPAAQSDKMVYVVAGMVGIVDIEANQEAGEGLVDLSGLNMRIDYQQEWLQIFHEAWRIQRDFFFDENLHGVDWPAMKKKYEALLPFVAFRTDLNYLIEQLFSELGQSHAEIHGGDFPEIPDVNSGVLGVDLEWDKAKRHYKITKIFRGQNWDPQRVSPLLQPGLNAQEGDYLLAIDGTPLTENLNPYSLLENKADETVSLTTHTQPTFTGSTEVRVKAAPFSEREGNFLRYNEWVLENMEKVNRASNGRIGYIHIPDTYIPGIEAFFRYFYPQRNKQALILDVRFNSGGYAPFWMIERLNRKPIYYSHFPYGKASLPEPDPGSFGPKVCLTNEWAESGGDIFAAYFRLDNSGLLIGKTTAGNLAASNGFRLMDGGIVIYPGQGIRNNRGENVIENIGIAPDVEVTNHPEQMIQGHDEQLERAVSELMKQLSTEEELEGAN